MREYDNLKMWEFENLKMSSMGEVQINHRINTPRFVTLRLVAPQIFTRHLVILHLVAPHPTPKPQPLKPNP